MNIIPDFKGAWERHLAAATTLAEDISAKLSEQFNKPNFEFPVRVYFSRWPCKDRLEMATEMIQQEAKKQGFECSIEPSQELEFLYVTFKPLDKEDEDEEEEMNSIQMVKAIQIQADYVPSRVWSMVQQELLMQEKPYWVNMMIFEERSWVGSVGQKSVNYLHDALINSLDGVIVEKSNDDCRVYRTPLGQIKIQLCDSHHHSLNSPTHIICEEGLVTQPAWNDVIVTLLSTPDVEFYTFKQ